MTFRSLIVSAIIVSTGGLRYSRMDASPPIVRKGKFGTRWHGCLDAVKDLADFYVNNSAYEITWSPVGRPSIRFIGANL